MKLKSYEKNRMPPKKLSREYNWNPIPNKYRKKVSNANIAEIAINEPNPVLKFKDWEGQYWKKKKDL